MRLFRYLDPTGGLATLEHNAIKATRPKYFNDPFEYLLRIKTGRPLFRKEVLSHPEIKKVLRENTDTRLRNLGISKPTAAETRQARLLAQKELRAVYDGEYGSGEEDSVKYSMEKLSNEMAVTCFSREENHPLMWSHYAQGHLGMLIEIDTETAFPIEPHIIKIKYVKEPPEYDYLDGELPNNSTTQKHFEEKILGRKFELWSYEKEHRIHFNVSILKKRLSPDGDEILLFEIPKQAIKKVVLGCRFPKEKMQELKRIMAVEGYEETQLYQAVTSTYSYKLDYRPYK